MSSVTVSMKLTAKQAGALYMKCCKLEDEVKKIKSQSIALAEALEALCIAYEEREYNAIGKLALASADAALASYRGEA